MRCINFNSPKWNPKWTGPFNEKYIFNTDKETDLFVNDMIALGLKDKMASYYGSPGDFPFFRYGNQWVSAADITFIITDRNVVRRKWDEYILAFRTDRLVSLDNYFSFAKHESKMFEVFYRYYKQFNRKTFSIVVKEDSFRYFEYLWVLQQEGICVINDIQSQDRNKFYQTDVPVGSILNITLTEEGFKKLQDFTTAKSNKHKQKKFLEKREWKNQHSWEDWSVNLDGKEVRYKGVLVDFSRAKKAYTLLCLLVKNKGSVSLFYSVTNALDYKVGQRKTDTMGNDREETEETVRCKINNIGQTIRKNVRTACAAK